METLWFWLVAAMLAAYVVFDGFDLGVGALHRLVARTPEERRVALRSIGPVWDGNEVWLIAAGGTLYFAFPTLYAASFSGFYLPLMIVLWLLILRGVSIEFRNLVSSPLWTSFFDTLFGLASLALGLFFGTALGNVVRGVPLDAEGWFFLPLWTDLRVSTRPGVVDWYTLTVGAAAVAALALHGAVWLAWRCAGALRARARRAAGRAWWAVLAATALVTTTSRIVRPGLFDNYVERPWGVVFPLLAVGSLLVARRALARDSGRNAFLASCGYLAGMLSSAAFSLYPAVLPALPGEPHSLTVENAAAGARGLSLGLVWWIPGMLLVALYFAYTYRRLDRDLGADEGGA